MPMNGSKIYSLTYHSNSQINSNKEKSTIITIKMQKTHSEKMQRKSEGS